MKSVLPNPFEATKATDFSDEQIRNYWVDLSDEEGMYELLKPRSPMSMHILGSKGSGKTHLMRYCSYPIQKLRHKADLLKGIQSDGYIGVYLLADGLNAGRFREKGQNQEVWRAVFAYYLELWLAEVVLDILANILGEGAENDHQATLCALICSQFDKWDAQVPENVAEFVAQLKGIRREIDLKVNNAALTRSLNIEISLTPGRLIFGIPKFITSAIEQFGNIEFVYLLDELENLSEEQQKFVNTLVRHRQGPCTFRIGARLYGVKTFETYSAGENNKEGSEFEVLRLDALLREQSAAYSEFARRLVAKRLQEAGYFSDASENIISLAKSIPRHFHSMSGDGYQWDEVRGFLAKYQNKERPYFKRLREQLEQGVRQARAPGISSDEAIAKIILAITCHENPLLEKLNILLLYQDWFRNRNLVLSSERIREQCKQFLNSREVVDGSYVQTLKHFKGDLIAQLYRDSGARPVYAGFDEFVQMSAGVPRYLLIILKYVFVWAKFLGEKPFVEGGISIEAQQSAVRDSANWFFSDAQPGEDGPAVREGIGKLAEYFREVRFSDKPVECSLVTFSVPAAQLSVRAQRVVSLAENWSFLIEISSGQLDKNSMRVDLKYQLNPMLAPRWDLPTGRRGTIPLTGEFVNSMFDRTSNSDFSSSLKERTSAMTAPTFGKARKKNSLTLDFGEDG